MKIKTGLSIFIILLLVGCGGGGSDSSSSSSSDNSNSDNSNSDNSSSDNSSSSSSSSSSSNSSTSSSSQSTTTSINDEYFSKQWYLAKNSSFYSYYGINDNASINAGNYLTTYTGKGVKIAVIDNGIDVNHEDLQGAIKGTYNSYTHTTNVSPASNDEYAHGTEVTGVLGARANNLDIYGSASSSDIYFIKYNPYGDTDASTINMFKQAVNFGADIINCSWGTNDVSDSVKEYIQSIANTGRDGKGVLVVFASGNGKYNNFTRQYEGVSMGNDESAIPEVIAVGASNTNNVRATYSNYGPNLDIIAPGGEEIRYQAQGIYTLSPYNQTTYSNGTSFSAPLVSGILAMMLEANPDLTRLQIQDILKNTSDKLGDVYYNSNGHNDYYGYGKINVKKAIDMALSFK